MNRTFLALSDVRKAGLKDVIKTAREKRTRQSKLLGDQSEACAFAPAAGGVFWQLKTDESGVIAEGIWPKDVTL